MNPLSDLVKKGRGVSKEGRTSQERAFNTIKEKLRQAPILRFSDYDHHFILYTDVSEHSVGGCFAQKVDADGERSLFF